jgi:hypothetical protein
MPHSKRKRNLIAKHMHKLNQTIKRLQILATTHNQNAQIITLPITLHKLRQEYSPRNQTLSQDIIDRAKTFRRVPIDPNRPVFIYGKDGGLIAYRTSLNNSEILQTLTQTIRELPKRTNLKFRGVYRGKYSTRHYCIWSPYSRKPFVSKELQEDEDAGLEFLKKNQNLWNRLSNILGGISPTTYKDFLRYPLPKQMKRFCTCWAGCVINIGGEDPVETEPHRDVKESKFGFSCIVPAGDYTGGGLICYELGLIIDLAPGSCFFFPDSLITHSNETVTGERSSIVAFTQENMFHYWKRKYGYINNKDKKGSKKILKRIKKFKEAAKVD